MKKRSGLQQGRGTAGKAPKDFKKGERAYREVFDGPNKTAEQDKIFKPKYSRVTHTQVSKATQGKPL